jgi:hypothetical protein
MSCGRHTNSHSADIFAHTLYDLAVIHIISNSDVSVGRDTTATRIARCHELQIKDRFGSFDSDLSLQLA